MMIPNDKQASTVSGSTNIATNIPVTWKVRIADTKTVIIEQNKLYTDISGFVPLK